MYGKRCANIVKVSKEKKKRYCPLKVGIALCYNYDAF